MIPGSRSIKFKTTYVTYATKEDLYAGIFYYTDTFEPIVAPTAFLMSKAIDQASKSLIDNYGNT